MPSGKLQVFHRKKTALVFFICAAALALLAVRLGWLMLGKSAYYSEKAQDLHERERPIKAARGRILDANGTVLADNRAVCTISVIHSQIEEPEAVISMLAKELEMDEETVRERVEKRSSIERIRTNVDKETGDRIRSYGYAGVKVDEDFKRYYPYDELASKVLGFTGSDNQGIIGLEVQYDQILQGTPGKILTLTDARGIELREAGESRLEPVPGDDLQISLDYNIQSYIEQEARRLLEQKGADSVSIIIMNPQNGEILGMTNTPEFDLNDPFTLPEEIEGTEEEALNQMWRNGCINDTYEPGSTFKIITAAAGLEEGAVSLEDSFYCPGYKIVEDRRIRCSKTTGPDLHGGGGKFLQSRFHRDRAAAWHGPVLCLSGTVRPAGKNRDRPAGRGGHHHAPAGKRGTGGAGHHGLRAVLSDYPRTAGGHGKFPDQRGNKGDAPPGGGGKRQPGRLKAGLFLSPGRADCLRPGVGNPPVSAGTGGVGRVRQPGLPGRVPHRRENRHLRNPAPQRQYLYFLLPGLRAGG